MKVSAIILAAGMGKRMGAGGNKQFLLIDQKPMIVHALQAFENCPLVHDMYLVVNRNDRALLENEVLRAYTFGKLRELVTGGELRQDSVINGITAVKKPCDVIVIHDGARPFVSTALIEKGIALMDSYDAVIPGLPVKDTIKTITRKGFVSRTLKRDTLWQVQTPQTFKYDVIAGAYRDGVLQNFHGYDDASFVERLGKKVKVIEGSSYNLKITTPEDLVLAVGIVSRAGSRETEYSSGEECP